MVDLKQLENFHRLSQTLERTAALRRHLHPTWADVARPDGATAARILGGPGFGHPADISNRGSLGLNIIDIGQAAALAPQAFTHLGGAGPPERLHQHPTTSNRPQPLFRWHVLGHEHINIPVPP